MQKVFWKCKVLQFPTFFQPMGDYPNFKQILLKVEVTLPITV